MTPRRLDQLEKELRAAAACRQYQEVSRLATELGQAVHAYTQGFPAADPRAAEAARKLDELFSWALVMMQAARGDCTAELRRVTTASRYGPSKAERIPSVHLDL